MLKVFNDLIGHFFSPLLSSHVIRPYSSLSSGLIIQSNRCPSFLFLPPVNPPPRQSCLILQHLHLPIWSLLASSVRSFSYPPLCGAFLFYLFYIPLSSIIFLLLSHFLPYLLSFLSPSSLFPAFICSVSAPQTGRYVTVRWCVGSLKGLKGSWQTLLLPSDTLRLISDYVPK